MILLGRRGTMKEQYTRMEEDDIDIRLLDKY